MAPETLAWISGEELMPLGHQQQKPTAVHGIRGARS